MSLAIPLSKLFLHLALAYLIFCARLIVGYPTYTYITSWCSEFGGRFDNSDASYLSDLNKLLFSLPENASQSINNGYYATNTTALGASSGSQIIYGLFLCRGDVTSDICEGCISTGNVRIEPQCPKSKAAVIWYDKCMIRYSNESFLGLVDEDVKVAWRNKEDVSSITGDVNGFMKLTGDTLSDLASQLTLTWNNPGLGDRKYYLSKEVEFNSFVKIFTMAQCTPDLQPVDCGRCLNIVIDEMATYCNGSKGGRTMNPSCSVRYETYPFYQNLTSPPPALPLSPESPPRPLPFSPVTSTEKGKTRTKGSLVVNYALGILVLILVILVAVLICLQCKKRKQDNDVEIIRNYSERAGENFMTAESLQYDFATLKLATDNFSEINKLGEGGFGIVYKGTLPNGQQVAVKRLSKDSHQGVEQFKNEVVFVAKLQHKNLVQLLGFCLAPDEKLLVYDFVPNKSLDLILFNPKTQGQLDWSSRYRIIQGIARGILYLHEDSRLKVVHRDLKASNILLDAEMVPKISDFGLARSFAANQEQDQTSRLAGTLGYMAPEYIEYGEISTKSDVYSFGVLVLEIISGKKISNRLHAENLLAYAWKHWKEGTPLEVVDDYLGDSYSSSEVIRCLHLCLMCVQGDVEERPSMLSIVFYLNSSFDLPTPQQPASMLTTRENSSSVNKERTYKSTISSSSSKTGGELSDISNSRSIHSFPGIE